MDPEMCKDVSPEYFMYNLILYFMTAAGLLMFKLNILDLV